MNLTFCFGKKIMVRWFLFYFSSHVFISIGDKTPYQILCLLLIWPVAHPSNTKRKKVVLRENLRECTPVPLSSVGRTSAQSVRGLGFKSQWLPFYLSLIPYLVISLLWWLGTIPNIVFILFYVIQEINKQKCSDVTQKSDRRNEALGLGRST